MATLAVHPWTALPSRRPGAEGSVVLTRGARVLLLLPLALLVMPFVLWPAAFGFAASFTSYSPFQAHPRFVGLANYVYLLKDPHFAESFLTAGLFSIITVPAELLMGLAMALILRKPFRGRSILRFLLLLPWLTSAVANGVMWHFLLSGEGGLPGFFSSLLALPVPPSPLGMPGQALPAAMFTEIWRNAPLAGFLFLPALLEIPPSLWDTALLEGASAARQVLVIAIPGLRPVLLVVGMLLLGSALGSFDTMLMLTGGGPGTRTLMPALYSYRMAYQANNWVAGSTSAWCIGLVAAIFGAGYLLMSRREFRE
jgi:multiple sugar transport system permease protein